jgi:hypothetical protein
VGKCPETGAELNHWPNEMVAFGKKGLTRLYPVYLAIGKLMV